MAARVPPDCIFTQQLEDDLARTAHRLGMSRVLVLTAPSRRFVDPVLAALADASPQVFAEAEVHVPTGVVERAATAARDHRADGLVALGGGSATGLGKALRLQLDVPFIAIPTTYAGSEVTNIYGMLQDGAKQTGRDDRVVPDAVLYAPALTLALPKRLTVQSLLNALAHPISALSTEELDEEGALGALEVVADTLFCLEQLAESPGDEDARLVALQCTARAGRIIHAGKLGAHHAIAHFLGGRFGLDHAALHSVLLPHTVAEMQSSQPGLFQRLVEAARVPDLPAALSDLLRRADAPTSLLDLGVDSAALAEAVAERPELPAGLIERASAGGRASARITLDGSMNTERPVRRRGPRLADARRVVIAVHGRGSNAADIVERAREITGDDPTIAIVAPQAPGNRWYAARYAAPLAELGEELPRALRTLEAVVDAVLREVPIERVAVFGFSQGACLASELVARGDRRFGGLVAIAGARIGPASEQPPIHADLAGMPVLLGAAHQDRWVSADDIERAANAFRDRGAEVMVQSELGHAHRITAMQRLAARAILTGIEPGPAPTGWGNDLSSEALPGALPRRQNSPRHPPYGLVAEQVNLTGFVAPRHENRRLWLYRARPSAQHGRFEPLAHPTFPCRFDEAAPDPSLAGWEPLPLPIEPTDFVDGLRTLAGAGSAELRRGCAIHLYVANQSMDERCFTNADGEWLVVPELGRLTLRTELGVLDVDPGQIAILPRGLKFSVLLRDGAARGWVGEVYGRSFRLPERGPVGANGLVDARHFRAPHASFEDRISPGYRCVVKFCDALFETSQDHSPYDVAAWHGNAVPFVYDLLDFSPVGNVLVDHPDPSIFSVLTAPLDEHGAHSLDFVFFPPRWEVAEGTFRPPFFHRNAVTELNGIIREPGSDASPFTAGLCFLTPATTAHGIRTHAVEDYLALSDEKAERPERMRDSSMWFQFETALPLRLTPWAAQAPHRIVGWSHRFGAYRSHYDPPMQSS